MPGAVFMQFKIFALTLAAYLPLITCGVQAKNLTIVDPAGKPVVNAVVSVTSDSTPSAGTAARPRSLPSLRRERPSRAPRARA